MYRGYASAIFLLLQFQPLTCLPTKAGSYYKRMHMQSHKNIDQEIPKDSPNENGPFNRYLFF